MKNELRKLFQRQAEWQESRQGLSWEEKMKIALIMRRELEIFSGKDPRDEDSAEGRTRVRTPQQSS